MSNGQTFNSPIKLIYTRGDNMTYGIYRPMYTATYRAALDANKNLIRFQVKEGGGTPEHAIHPNRRLLRVLVYSEKTGSVGSFWFADSFDNNLKPELSLV